MAGVENYAAINMANWDERVPAHAASPDYHVADFIADPAYLSAMERLSQSAYAAYRGLVYETDGFERYFWASTVITEIATLNIGSRPASRKKTTAIEGHAAALWVGSRTLQVPGQPICAGMGRRDAVW